MRLGILAVAAVLGVAIGPAAVHAADETTQLGVNPQHSNSVSDSPLRPPLQLHWQVNLGHVSSNVIVADGRVFYVRDPEGPLQITALRASDGAHLWSRPWTATNWGRNGLAYGGGRLFVVGNSRGERPRDVHVEALDAISGALIWSRAMPADYGAGSFPTVAAGELYLLAAGEATQLYALRQSDGSDRWGPKTLPGGDSSTPALDGASVYVSLGGPQTFAFDRTTGAQRWHYGVCCGGGGTTPMVVGDRLFADGGLIHDVRDGSVLGDYWSGGIPTWSGDLGVAYGNNVLRGFGPTFETTRWTFQIDRYGGYLSAPFIAGPYAYVSTTDLPPWHLMALRLTDGGRDWCKLIDLPPGSYSSARPRPVAAGHGLLLVSKGYGLAAYASGGQPSACESLPPSSSTAGHPSLELTVSRRTLRLGRRTRLAGRLSGVPDASGRTIAFDVDPWPFDGRYRRAGLATTGSDGTAALRYAPRRNVRMRARLVGELELVSRPATVYAELPVSVRKQDPGGRHARLRVTIRGAGRAQVSRRRVYGYLARAAKPWRRVADGRWRLGPRSATVTLRYPRGRLRQGDRWLVCTRERKPDAFGRPKPLDRLCGRRTLPR